MSSTYRRCTNVLARTPAILPRPSTCTRSLHTTPSFFHPAPKKPAGKAAPQKGSTLRLGSKKTHAPRGKAPPPGERRLQKERILLSDPNAPQIVLPPLTKELCTDHGVVGSLYGIPTDLIERLRTLKAFQKSQMWQYFYRPTTQIRVESIKIGKAMAEVDSPAAEVEERKETRYNTKSFILEGGAGVGKSILLLQSIVWALQRGWLVITIPDAHDLTMGHTEYEQNSKTKLWDQSTYLKALLLQTLEANVTVLGQHTLKNEFHLGTTTVAVGLPLSKLVEVGAKNAEFAPQVWEALLKELELEGAPPTLMTMDNMDYIMRNSEYKDTEFKTIHAHDLALPNTFLSLLSGTNLAVNGEVKKRHFHKGIVLAATTSELHLNPSFQYALTSRPIPQIGARWDRRLPASLGTRPTILRVQALTQNHTAKLLEYYRKCGVWDDAWEASVPLETAYMVDGKRAKLTVPIATVGLNNQLKRQAEVAKNWVERVSDGVEEGRGMRRDEVVLKHVLTGGRPRELLKACLRLT